MEKKRKGWWGNPEGHSVAAKKGKRDLIKDFKDKIILYHFTSKKSAEKIKKEGLKGGHNIHGIGYSSKHTLWLTDSMRADAERYGDYILKIEISKKELQKLNPVYKEIGGENIYYIEKEGIIISPDLISDPYEEYEFGVCEPSKWCEAYCSESDTCQLIKEYKTESEGNKGKGWHGEPERRPQAARKGKGWFGEKKRHSEAALKGVLRKVKRRAERKLKN